MLFGAVECQSQGSLGESAAPRGLRWNDHARGRAGCDPRRLACALSQLFWRTPKIIVPALLTAVPNGANMRHQQRREQMTATFDTRNHPILIDEDRRITCGNYSIEPWYFDGRKESGVKSYIIYNRFNSMYDCK